MSEMFDELLSTIDSMNDEDELMSLNAVLIDRVKALRQQKARRTMATLKVGSRVRVSDEVRPAKYRGAEGVVRMMPTTACSNKVSVMLDGQTVPLKVPVGVLEAI